MLCYNHPFATPFAHALPSSLSDCHLSYQSIADFSSSPPAIVERLSTGSDKRGAPARSSKARAFQNQPVAVSTTKSTRFKAVEEVQDLRFSPNGHWLAVASRDNCIYIFDASVDGAYQRAGVCRGHSSFVTHVDWAVDSTTLMSSDGAYEILFWEIEAESGKPKQQTNAFRLRDTTWASFTQTLGWPVSVFAAPPSTRARARPLYPYPGRRSSGSGAMVQMAQTSVRLIEITADGRSLQPTTFLWYDCTAFRGLRRELRVKSTEDILLML